MKISNKDILQSYIMTTAKYDYSADEKRIMLILIETLQENLEGKTLKGKIVLDKRGDYQVSLPLSHFVTDGQTNYKRIKAALLALNEKRFEYVDSKIWQVIRLIEKPIIEIGENVKFELNPKIVDCFLDFTKGYRKFELETSLMFSSVYAMRFYELFSGQKKPLTFSIQNLKEMFQITDKYKQTRDFIQRVILVAKKELDEKAPFSFEFETDMERCRRLGIPCKKINAIHFYPVAIPKNRDKELETKSLIKQTHLSWDFDKVERDYLHDMGFTDKEIKNNFKIFMDAKNELDDFLYELSVIKGNIRDKRNPKGWVIRALEGKVNDKRKSMK